VRSAEPRIPEAFPATGQYGHPRDVTDAALPTKARIRQAADRPRPPHDRRGLEGEGGVAELLKSVGSVRAIRSIRPIGGVPPTVRGLRWGFGITGVRAVHLCRDPLFRHVIVEAQTS